MRAFDKFQRTKVAPWRIFLVAPCCCCKERLYLSRRDVVHSGCPSVAGPPRHNATKHSSFVSRSFSCLQVSVPNIFSRALIFLSASQSPSSSTKSVFNLARRTTPASISFWPFSLFFRSERCGGGCMKCQLTHQPFTKYSE